MRALRESYLCSVVLAVAACAGPIKEVQPVLQDPRLNSERISARFGSYGIDVRYADAHWRIAELYSGTGAKRRTRTLAIVEFADTAPAELEPELAAIRGGRSIGRTLTEAGWRVDKHTLWAGEIGSDLLEPPIRALLCGKPDEPIALWRYRLAATRGNQAIDVVRITELYDPEYLTREELMGARTMSTAVPADVRAAIAQLVATPMVSRSELRSCD